LLWEDEEESDVVGIKSLGGQTRLSGLELSAVGWLMSLELKQGRERLEMMTTWSTINEMKTLVWHMTVWILS
jgi:hypothetical protein